MPYSTPLIPDRQALVRFTYQIRKLCRELAGMGVPSPYRDLLRQKLHDLEQLLKCAQIDYDDDGSLLDSPDNEWLRERLGQPHKPAMCSQCHGEQEPVDAEGVCKTCREWDEEED